MSLVSMPDENGEVTLMEEVSVTIHPRWTEVIPKGFKFDGASIPRFAWSVVGHPFSGKLVRGAMVHDWLYRTGSSGHRAIADAVFLHLLKEDKVAVWRRWVIYLSVRFFGRYSYREKSS